MEERRDRQERCRTREFESYVAGAGGRLLRAARLLSGEPPGAAPAARRLLEGALAETYADWDRLRGADPYEHTRRTLAARFARHAWRHRRPRGGVLGELPPRERLVLVLRMYEEVAEEQTAAVLGLPRERVRMLCARGVTRLLAASPTRTTAPAAPPRASGPRLPRSQQPPSSGLQQGARRGTLDDPRPGGAG
ncbi:RNA polymerase [Streptomyces sp. AJS327]|uniref:sigma factor-like helix-turn-helix DNA-binding protein n=1 Tax=Streptomyces sp. AJS327 TaxID=2545265 RepID=UPI0015DE24E7|nr:sigma factor-like helix-turn-helix DNA-binding protein [Streptomyces sp. AJS327]MBA0054237.1 RNA polymerase [Streptomyces sp. AJS327]